ncbi:unnamed protein product [Heterobilharzia americana]|nr:unnamed protein product [Heterobilharzia americana]
MFLRTISLLTLVLCSVILFENVQGQRDPPCKFSELPISRNPSENNNNNNNIAFLTHRIYHSEKQEDSPPPPTHCTLHFHLSHISDANDYKSAITTDSINTDDANDYNEEYSKMFNSLKRLDEIMKIFELAKE